MSSSAPTQMSITQDQLTWFIDHFKAYPAKISVSDYVTGLPGALDQGSTRIWSTNSPCSKSTTGPNANSRHLAPAYSSVFGLRAYPCKKCDQLVGLYSNEADRMQLELQKTGHRHIQPAGSVRDNLAAVQTQVNSILSGLAQHYGQTRSSKKEPDLSMYRSIAPSGPSRPSPSAVMTEWPVAIPISGGNTTAMDGLQHDLGPKIAPPRQQSQVNVPYPAAFSDTADLAQLPDMPVDPMYGQALLGGLTDPSSQIPPYPVGNPYFTGELTQAPESMFRYGGVDPAQSGPYLYPYDQVPAAASVPSFTQMPPYPEGSMPLTALTSSYAAGPAYLPYAECQLWAQGGPCDLTASDTSQASVYCAPGCCCASCVYNAR